MPSNFKSSLNAYFTIESVFFDYLFNLDENNLVIVNLTTFGNSALGSGVVISEEISNETVAIKTSGLQLEDNIA